MGDKTCVKSCTRTLISSSEKLWWALLTLFSILLKHHRNQTAMCQKHLENMNILIHFKYVFVIIFLIFIYFLIIIWKVLSSWLCFAWQAPHSSFRNIHILCALISLGRVDCKCHRGDELCSQIDKTPQEPSKQYTYQTTYFFQMTSTFLN